MPFLKKLIPIIKVVLSFSLDCIIFFSSFYFSELKLKLKLKLKFRKMLQLWKSSFLMNNTKQDNMLIQYLTQTGWQWHFRVT